MPVRQLPPVLGPSVPSRLASCSPASAQPSVPKVHTHTYTQTAWQHTHTVWCQLAGLSGLNSRRTFTNTHTRWHTPLNQNKVLHLVFLASKLDALSVYATPRRHFVFSFWVQIFTNLPVIPRARQSERLNPRETLSHVSPLKSWPAGPCTM